MEHQQVSNEVKILHQKVRGFLKQGMTESAIISELQKLGIDANYAEIIIANVHNDIHDRKSFWKLLFGGLFTILQIGIVETAHTTGSLNILFSIVSAYIVETYFWNRFIGNSTFYRAKPIWVPLGIGLALMVPARFYTEFLLVALHVVRVTFTTGCFSQVNGFQGNAQAQT